MYQTQCPIRKNFKKRQSHFTFAHKKSGTSPLVLARKAQDIRNIQTQETNDGPGKGVWSKKENYKKEPQFRDYGINQMKENIEKRTMAEYKRPSKNLRKKLLKSETDLYRLPIFSPRREYFGAGKSGKEKGKSAQQQYSPRCTSLRENMEMRKAQQAQSQKRYVIQDPSNLKNSVKTEATREIMSLENSMESMMEYYRDESISCKAELKKSEKKIRELQQTIYEERKKSLCVKQFYQSKISLLKMRMKQENPRLGHLYCYEEKETKLKDEMIVELSFEEQSCVGHSSFKLSEELNLSIESK